MSYRQPVTFLTSALLLAMSCGGGDADPLGSEPTADANETADGMDGAPDTPGAIPGADTRVPADLPSDAPSASPEWTPLVEPDLWTVTSSSEDPYANVRAPGMEPCHAEDFGAIDLSDLRVFRVLAKQCAFVTVQQPLLQTVDAGEEIMLWAGHSLLTDTAGTFVAGVVAGPSHTVLWETSVEAPKTSYGSFMETLIASETLEAGTTIYFHLGLHAPP